MTTVLVAFEWSTGLSLAVLWFVLFSFCVWWIWSLGPKKHADDCPCERCREKRRQL